MNSKPSKIVSIIVPVFNRGKLIGETLNSVLGQFYSNWECIVIDDGSSDNTIDIVNSYTKRDSRIKIYERPNTYKPGGNGARNYGYDISSGDYIQFLDSDDLLHPSKLEIQLDELINSQGANYIVCENLVFSDPKIKANKRWFGSSADSENRLRSYVFKKLSIQTASPIFRKAFLEEIKNESGLFNQDLKQSQEWELFCRVLCKDPNYLYNPDTLLYIRETKNSITAEYLKSNPLYIQSQIEALELVHEHLKGKKVLTDELNYYFINSGVTILKRIYNKKLNNSIRNLCDAYIQNCLPESLYSRFYKIKYELGKLIWSKFRRGHMLLKY